MATIEQTTPETPTDSTDVVDSRVALPAGTPPAQTHEHGHDDHGGHGGAGLTNVKLGMWLFLASDCLFFGAFISAYLLYRGRPQDGPTPHELFNIPFTSATSFILLMSSLGMVLALAAIQRGDHRRFRLWLLATALFGATFIAGQVYEFTEFYREGLHLDTNLFGSTFFVLTGFHGAHVTLGTIMLAIIWLRCARGHFSRDDHFAFEAVAWYWHFVDVVWLGLFLFVYVL